MEHRTIIVIPCYNEAGRLDRAAFRAFVAEEASVGFVFVDDGSTDDTGRALVDLAMELGHRAQVIRLPENRGKAAAVRRGLQEAMDGSASLVGYWDADLATPLREILSLRALLIERQEVQIAIGSRVRLLGRRIDRRPMRHYAGRVFATAVSALCRLPVYDTQCGAKLLRVTEDVRAILAEPFTTRWTFDVELLVRYERRVAARGRDAAKELREHPLEEWRDVAGSKVRAWDFVTAGIDLVRIWRTYPRHPRVADR